MKFASPLTHDEERVDAWYDGEPLRYRTMDNVLGDQPVPGLMPRDLERSYNSRVRTANHGPLQRPREMRHGAPR